MASEASIQRSERGTKRAERLYKDQYLLALVGHPVSHSISPILHKAALKYAGLKGDYLLLDVTEEELEKLVFRLIRDNYSGFNVTIPYKQRVVSLCRELTNEAERVGAVNCVGVPRGKTELVGHNTDIEGLKRALNSNYKHDFSGKTACILGAGGAAKATVVALSDLGVQDITIIARDIKKAYSLATEFGARASLPIFVLSTEKIRLERQVDLVINSTPVGQTFDDVPDWFEGLTSYMTPESLFFDMVYRLDAETPLVGSMRRHGFRAVDGIDMLVEQALLSFQFWTGITIPKAVMNEALRDQLPIERKSSEMKRGDAEATTEELPERI